MANKQYEAKMITIKAGKKQKKEKKHLSNTYHGFFFHATKDVEITVDDQYENKNNNPARPKIGSRFNK